MNEIDRERREESAQDRLSLIGPSDHLRQICRKLPFLEGVFILRQPLTAGERARIAD
jgi:hypothetical protein